MRRSSTGDHARQTLHLLDPGEYEEVDNFNYSTQTGHSKLLSRPLSRKVTFILGGLLALFILATLSVKTHVIGHLPVLDTTSNVVQASSSQTKPGTRKALVVSSYKTQDVKWIKELKSDLTSGWQIYRYVGDAPKTPKSKYLTLPRADGREALTYLTFIVDNYNDLPDYTVFIHGHDKAWHQPEYIVDKLSAINFTALHHEEYFNLRCNVSPGCTADTKFYYDGTHPEDHRAATNMRPFWDDMLYDNFGPMPAVIGRRCCAQFAASKAAIIKQPKKFWQKIREPLVAGPEVKQQKWREQISGHRVGLYYENIWHILMGKPADYCTPTEHCQKVQFQDKIHCDGEVMTWDDRDKWTNITCYNDLRVALEGGE